MKRSVRPLVIGNWKMNPQSKNQAKRLAEDIKKGLSKNSGVSVVLAPPFVFIPTIEDVRNGSRLFSVAAQDVFWEKLGPRTGEVSTAMLGSLGVTYVIVGHSERRAMGETDETVNKKIHAVLKEGLTPVVCVGERKRDHGAQYLNFVEEQIRKACAGLSKAKLQELVVAYEPIWAISHGDGKGHTATAADAHEMKIFIQKVLTDTYGRAPAHKVRILYGGSVNPKNAAELMEDGMVDGFLVGGASLRADDFLTVVKESK